MLILEYIFRRIRDLTSYLVNGKIIEEHLLLNPFDWQLQHQHICLLSVQVYNYKVFWRRESSSNFGFPQTIACYFTTAGMPLLDLSDFYCSQVLHLYDEMFPI